jgi:hypothetical protein
MAYYTSNQPLVKIHTIHVDGNFDGFFESEESCYRVGNFA